MKENKKLRESRYRMKNKGRNMLYLLLSLFL